MLSNYDFCIKQLGMLSLHLDGMLAWLQVFPLYQVAATNHWNQLIYLWVERGSVSVLPKKIKHSDLDQHYILQSYNMPLTVIVPDPLGAQKDLYQYIG